MPSFIGTAVYRHFVALSSALIVAGCGGASSPPLSAGPIVVQTSLETDGTQPTSPLAPGQSVTFAFFERRCRYQQYTSEASRGQYRLLGCDNPTVPRALNVSVTPIPGTGQPCPVSTSRPFANTLMFTKNGPGDPGLGGPPNFWCTITVSDPTLSDPSSGFDFRM